MLLSSSFLVTSLQAFDDADEAPPSNAVASSQKKKETDSAPSTALNPFSDAQKSFGFDVLKEWDKSNSTKKGKWEQENKARLRQAVEAKIKGELQQAEELWKEGAQNGCPTSMFWLGKAAEDRQNEEGAFSWYVLSLWTQLLKGIPLQTIQEVYANPWKSLVKLTSTPSYPAAHKTYFSYLQKEIPSRESQLKSGKTISVRSLILCDILVNAHIASLIFDERISAFTVGLAGWLQSNEALTVLGNFFYKQPDAIAKAAYCYRHSPTPENLLNLGFLINEGIIVCDARGQTIKPAQKDKVVARLCRKSGTPDALYHLACFIRDGRIHQDEKGVDIEKGKEDQVVARLYRKSGTPDALFNLGCFITQGRIQQDEKGVDIEKGKEDQVVARLYRKSGTPKALFNLGCFITQGRIQQDEYGVEIENGQEGQVLDRLYRKSGIPEALFKLACLITEGRLQHDENEVEIENGEEDQVVARLCRKSGTPDALFNLGCFITQGRIHQDEKGVDIEKGKEDQVVAHLYRKSGTPKALYNLACLITEGRIQYDENEVEIENGEEDQVVARLYRKSGTPDALFNLGCFITQGRIQQDEKGVDIEKGKEDQVVAHLYRKSGTPKALFNLGCFITQGRIHQDEYGVEIENGQEGQVLDRLYRKSGIPEALINLALLKLRSSSGQTLDGRKEALSLFLQAALQGDKKAQDCYVQLKEDIEKIEPSLQLNQETSDDLQHADQVSLKEEESSSSDSEEDPEESKAPNSDPVLSPAPPDNQPVTQADPAPEEALSLDARKKRKAIKKEQKKQTKTKVKANLKKLMSQDATERENGFSLLRTSEMITRKSDAKENLQIVWEKGVKDIFNSLPSYQAKKVLKLIDDIKIGGNLGNPKTLTGGSMSRRITGEDRLVYRLEKGTLKITSCKGHYGLKVDTKAEAKTETKAEAYPHSSKNDKRK